MAWDPIRQGYSWRAQTVVSPAQGETSADVVTLLTGSTPYIKLLTAAGTEELVATAGTVDAATRTITFTLSTTATAALTIGQYRAVTYVTKSSDKWAVIPVEDEDELVEVRSE